MEPATTQPKGSSRVRVAALVAGLVIVAVIVWLATRGCDSPAEPAPRGFDYFHAKAEELGRDPEKVKAFVADDIKTVSGKGNVKGPLATLWNGAGTNTEKAQLLDVLLACCDPATQSHLAWDLRGPHDETTSLSVVLEVSAGGKTKSTAVVKQGCSWFVGAGHSLEIGSDGKAKLTIRAYGSDPAVREIDVTDADAAQLRFTLTDPLTKPREVIRELWNKDNGTGPTWGIPGDRHDFIVLPSRVSKFVREKEEVRLKEAKRENDADAKAYLALLDYCLESDELLAGIEKENGVTALFDLPRILILSKFNLPEFVGGPTQALDLRLNHVNFEGEKVAAYASVQTRSMLEAGLETVWLAEFTGAPCTSAHDVISALREDYPDQPARRLQAVLEALDAASSQPAGTTLTFAASDPANSNALKPEVTLTKQDDGKWSIRSGPLHAGIVADLEKNPDMPRLTLNDGRIDGTTDSHERLALLVEVGLMAADVKPQTGSRYVLQSRLTATPPSLVMEGASFKFAWGSGDDRVDQHIVISSCGGALVLVARVQSGVRPVSGDRTIPAAALDTATLHNPWYAQGSDSQKDATTFVISRQVFAALKAGQSSDFSLQGRYANTEDAAEGKPRPITWTGKLEPVGTGTATVRINNRDETITILRCKAGEREIAILDDARWPVGMADKLTEVNTGIRCRLVDFGGTPIGGAVVSIDDVRITTAFDGSFTVPPRKAGGYLKTKPTVTRGEDPYGDTEIDLKSPGLSEVVVLVNRPLKDLLFIHPSERARLDPLKLSAQVKRHANAAFDSGLCVMIPSAMIHMGGEEEIAFYSFDPATGENIGVMETGLHGSMSSFKSAWRDAAKKTGKEAWDNRKDIAEGGLPPIHMLRGAIVAWFTYCSYRLEGSSNVEALMRMLADMEYWESTSNFLAQAEKAVGGRAGAQVREKLGGAMGGNMDGGAAAVAFQCGYLGSAAFLAKFMADRGNDD